MKKGNKTKTCDSELNNIKPAPERKPVKFHGPAFGGLETTDHLTDSQIEVHAKELLTQLTLDEKIAMMSGDTPFWPGLKEMFGRLLRRPSLGVRGRVAAGRTGITP